MKMSIVVKFSSLVGVNKRHREGLFQNIKLVFEPHTSCDCKYNNKWTEQIRLFSKSMSAPVQDVLDDLVDLCACDCTPQPVRTLPSLYVSHLGRVVHRSVLELEVVYVVDAHRGRQV